MTTYYLSGPMSGIEGNNFPCFERVTRALRCAGLRIVSPHEQALRPYQDSLRHDLHLITREVNALILLPGWMRSRGAQLEVHTACMLELPVYLLVSHDEQYQRFDLIDINTAERR